MSDNPKSYPERADFAAFVDRHIEEFITDDELEADIEQSTRRVYEHAEPGVFDPYLESLYQSERDEFLGDTAERECPS